MTKSELLALAEEIKNETVASANSATRIGTLLDAIIAYIVSVPTDWNGVTDISASLRGESYRMWPAGANFEDSDGNVQAYPPGTIMLKLNNTVGLAGANWSLT